MKLKLATLLKALIDGTLSVHRIVNQIDSWEEDDIRTHVDESFFNIVKYAYDNVPYYHRMLIEYGYTPNSFTSATSISMLPKLTKDDIRGHYDDLRSD